jgi:hypothetical protein
MTGVRSHFFRFHPEGLAFSALRRHSSTQASSEGPGTPANPGCADTVRSNDMTRITFRLCGAVLAASALASAPLALAGVSESDAGVRAALAKAAQGPDQLRQYVQRTKLIYQLDFNDIMSLAESKRMASGGQATKVARADKH